MNRVFLDTEFTGLHQRAGLISVGLASEQGRVFYAELTDYDRSETGDWVAAHVLPLLSVNLPPAHNVSSSSDVFCQGTKGEVANALRRWLAPFGGKNSVEVWADVLAWDWVLFCEMFGGPFGLPEQIHYIPRDLSTLLALRDIDPDTTREDLGQVTWSHPALHLKKHHALYDALLEKAVFERLNST